jgi:hypothetical protein
MSFFDIANGKLLYILVTLVIIYILIQCVIFLRISLNRAKELGIKNNVIKNIVRSSAVFTIVPSIAVVLGLAALAPSIGIPWSWLRLSVIGSVSYELTAANMASSSLGFASLSKASASGPQTLGIIMFAMSTGVAGGMIMDLLFIKKVNSTVTKFRAKSGEFGIVALSVLFSAVLVVFIAPIFGKGKVYVLTFLSSMIFVIIQSLIIKKFKVAWLKNFVLAFSLLLGMCSSVLWTVIFK